MTRRARSLAILVALAVAGLCAAPPTHAAPEGLLAWGVHIDRMVFIPVMGSVFLNGVNQRAEVHGLGLIASYPYSAPYEDLELRKQ